MKPFSNLKHIVMVLWPATVLIHSRRSRQLFFVAVGSFAKRVNKKRQCALTIQHQTADK